MIDCTAEKETAKVITCKHCGSTANVKYGTYKGSQRYYCKVCQRKFKDDETHFHMKVPSQCVITALSMHYTSMSFDEIRRHLKQEYSYYPSKSVIFNWVNKYSNLAQQQFKDYHPEVGDTWIVDESMLDIDGQHQVWFCDIIDTKTRFILASRVTLTRTIKNIQSLMEEAEKRARKIPKIVRTDSNCSYLDGIDNVFGNNTEHIRNRHTTIENDTQKMERLKHRVKLFKVFKDFKTVVKYSGGWLIYYNYFRPNQFLDGKTPAEFAKIKYKIKSWAELGRFSPEKLQAKPKINLQRYAKR